MANATDFIASIYNTLATTFNMGGSPPPNLFMQMAWPGISISSDDCKDKNGHYDPFLAEELFSSIANIAPSLSKSKFENSAFYIDDLYDIILSSARPNGVADTDLEVNPLYKLFADAQYEFGRYVRGSNVDPLEIYHPCKATPSNWYDETAASYWTQINIRSDQIKSVDTNSPFVRLNVLKLVESGIMKVKTRNDIKLPINTRLTNISLNNKNILDDKFKTASFTTTPSLFKTNSEKVFRTMHTNKVDQPNVILNNSFKVKLLAVNTENRIKRPLPLNSFLKNDKLVNNVKNQDINIDKFIVKPKVFSAKDSVFLNDLLIKDLPTQPSVGSDGFSISFKFCRVNIDRPWLNLALLSMPGWNIYGASQGQYSSGSAENNAGIFPMLTTSFILISNVCITANWSAPDKANIVNAVSFGPFDIRNSTFNQNKLEIKGMQIIGCFSKLTPILAPTASPS